ncbi:MAG: two-component system sensor histidine kinase CreC [Akkermansiaceae bacterium]
MKIRLTRLIVLIMAVVTSAGFLMLYQYLTDDLEDQTFQATEECLIDTAHILTGIIESDITQDTIQTNRLKSALDKAHDHEFNATVFKLIKTQVGTHVYVTNDKGIVIYDSKNKHTGMDLSQHNDVFKANQDIYAARSSRDHEHDANSSVLYIGVPIKHDGKIIGTLTTYKAQQDVRPFITSRRKWITLSVTMIAVGIIVFTIAVFTWIFRPIGKLTQYAHAITRGERPIAPRLGRGREVNTLGSALKEMRDTLDGRSYVEDYTQILTHELKSPLAAIRGSAELLQEDMPLEQRRKFLTNIQNETNRSQRIIDGLLKLSHLEAQPQLLKREDINLLTLANQLSDAHAHRLETKNLPLEIDIPSDLTIKGDENLLQAALANLLENSIHFSPENGQIKLTATATEGKTTITITDQGPGIPDYALPRVFERFYSISKPNTSQKSSGLGLSFVKEIIDLHQGTIQLENISPPELGTKATIII